MREQEACSRATLVEKIALGSKDKDDQVNVIGMAVWRDIVSIILEDDPNVLNFQFIDGHLKRLEDIKLDGPPACISYIQDGLLIGLENGKLLLYQNDRITHHELYTIPDPILRKCSHLRKTVHRLSDE